MKKLTVLLLGLFSWIGMQAQNTNEVYNRYGFALSKEAKGWRVRNEANLIRKFNFDPRTIKGWSEPYTYVPNQVKPEDYKRCTVESVVYKKYPTYECRMDVYLPKNQHKPHPYIMFIHGGGWKRGNEKDMKNLASYFASNGIASISISYTLLSQGTFSATRQDILDAKAYIEKNAEAWHIDTTSFGFSGFSAGGHLSSYMAMITPGTKVLLSIAGAHNLYKYGNSWNKAPNPALWRYFEVDKEGETILKKWSPYHQIPQQIPAVMLIHGTFDGAIPYQQSIDFAKELTAKGAKVVKMLTVENTQHVVMRPQNVATYEDNLKKMFSFAKKYLKQ